MTIDQWTKFVRSIVGDAQAEAILRSRNVPNILALAKSKGFAFTEDDLADVMRARDCELTDEALDQVSGRGRSEIRSGDLLTPAPRANSVRSTRARRHSHLCRYQAFWRALARRSGVSGGLSQRSAAGECSLD